MVETSVKLPLTPEEIIQVLEATAQSYPGKLRVVPSRAAITVPAGFQYSIVVTVPSGWVSIGSKGIQIFSDYYSENILMDVWVDNYKVNPFPIPISAPVKVNFGTYYIQKRQIVVDIVNYSARNATLTIDCIAYLLDKKLFEEFFLPLVQLNYKTLKELVGGVHAER